MLHLRELQVLRRVCVVERYRGLWENWLIAKTAFPSPRCEHLRGHMTPSHGIPNCKPLFLYQQLRRSMLLFQLQ